MGVYFALGFIYVIFGLLSAWATDEDYGHKLHRKFGKDVKEGIIALAGLFWPIVFAGFMIYGGFLLSVVVVVSVIAAILAVLKLIWIGICFAFRSLAKVGEAIVDIFVD